MTATDKIAAGVRKAGRKLPRELALKKTNSSAEHYCQMRIRMFIASHTPS
jgi:hypothetical protein